MIYQAKKNYSTRIHECDVIAEVTYEIESPDLAMNVGRNSVDSTITSLENKLHIKSPVRPHE